MLQSCFLPLLIFQVEMVTRFTVSPTTPFHGQVAGDERIDAAIQDQIDQCLGC